MSNSTFDKTCATPCKRSFKTNWKWASLTNEGCARLALAFTSSSTGASYRIVLNLEDMEYYIRNERTKEFVFKSKKYTNLNVLKRKARNELSRFGVQLGKESRDRQFGLCPKGMTQKKWEMLKEMEE